MDGMKWKFCVTCHEETWHNPLKVVPKAPKEFRCTRCGMPRRSGHKNYGILRGGKVIMEAKP
jgi:hypothetical protein